MSSKPPSDPNRAFYDRHAHDFGKRTLHLDMTPLYEPFLSRLAPGARILDAGCGPGRDLGHLARSGYATVGIDASAAMVELARQHSGQPVHHLRFQELDWEEAFDGVWASASLLHVPPDEMPDAFERLGRALRPGGVWFVSFKYGKGERFERGRRFTDCDESMLQRLVSLVPRVEQECVWRTSDLRPERTNVGWLNAILRKTPS